MASDRQIAANRRNAVNSTGPRTPDGKLRSRQNAFRHGLTAETVVTFIEHREEYEAFEQEISADYRPTSALEHQLVARVASLLWRLRRATLIETGLLEAQVRSGMRQQREARRKLEHPRLGTFYRMLGEPLTERSDPAADAIPSEDLDNKIDQTRMTNPAAAFLRLCRAQSNPFERLNRYEVMLWRQLSQTILAVEEIRERTSTNSPATVVNGPI